MTSRDVIARAQTRVGTILRGKYRIDKVLGAGGMAVVYEVTHRNQKRFALKMLHVELSMHEDIRRRFLREGYAANTVDHPGAVVVIDDDTAEDGAAFLVMELLDGRPLDELLAQNERRVPAEAVLSAAEQTLEVLVPAHAKGIVHRDIKPANLFALRDGTLKVLDFGIARLHDAAGSGQATHTGVMLGTPAYMPPEQALSQASQIDAQTDLWSVGATMFTLLSGANVHQGQTATQILVAAASQKARSVTSVAPWVDERIAAVVARAVAFEKSDRFATAGEMRDAVRRVHEEVFGAPPSRAALAVLIGPGQRKAANPDAFIISESAAAPFPQAAVTVEGGAAKAADEEPRSSPLAQSVGATPATSGAQQSSVGFSTAKPVSGGAAPARTASGSRGGMQWIAVAAVVIGVGAVVVALRSSNGNSAVAGPPSTPTATSSPAPTASPMPTATPTPSATPTPTASTTPTPSADPSAMPAATTTASTAPNRSALDKRIPQPKPVPPSPQPSPAPSARKPAASDDDLFHP
jgi:eukaryotic-like serine/threonine-protein kinase